jgi:hypothetical protein
MLFVNIIRYLKILARKTQYSNQQGKIKTGRKTG